MAWYDNAVFYHIYPLGLCGCAHENDGQPVPGAFKKLDAWAQHAAKLGCTAIYIGPLFESGSHRQKERSRKANVIKLRLSARSKKYPPRFKRGGYFFVMIRFYFVGRTMTCPS